MECLGIIRMGRFIAAGRTAGYLIAAVGLAAAATGCGSAAGTSASPTAAASTASSTTAPTTTTAPASTSAPAQGASGLDSCAVGKWTATSITIGPATGGAGTLLTINGDGSSTVDVSAGAPISGTLNGHTYTSKGSGTGTLHFATLNGGQATVDTQDFSTVTYTRTTDGVSQPGGTNPKSLLSASVTYTCSSSALVITDQPNATVYTFSH